MSLSTDDLDAMGRRAAGDTQRSARQRAARPTADSLRIRHQKRRRRRQTTIGVTTLLAGVLAVSLVVQPTVPDESIEIVDPAEGSETSAVTATDEPSGSDGNVVLVLPDNADTFAYLDPQAQTVRQGQGIDGHRAGDQPHQLIYTGGRFVVGWGEVFSTDVEGGDSISLGAGEFAVPAVEDGTVWLIDYPGVESNPADPADARRVDVQTGAVVEEGTLPGAIYPHHGIPGGLAVVSQDSSGDLSLWRAADQDVLTPVDSNSQVVGVHAAGDTLAFCEALCEAVGVIDVTDPERVVRIPLGQTVEGAARSVRVSPDQRRVAIGARILAEESNAASASVVVAEIGRLPDLEVERRIPVQFDAPARLGTVTLPLWIGWAPTSDDLFATTSAVQGEDVTGTDLHRIDVSAALSQTAEDTTGAQDSGSEEEASQVPAEFLTTEHIPTLSNIGTGGAVLPRGTVSIPPATPDGLLACNGSARTAGGCTWALSEPTPDGPSEPAWTAIPDAPIGPRPFAVSEWTGQGFLVWGGYNNSNSDGVVHDAGIYDPSAEEWRSIAAPDIAAAQSAQSFVGPDAVYVLGGFTGEAGRDPSRQAAAWNIATQEWRALPDVPEDVVAAAWLDGRAVVLSSSGSFFALSADGRTWETLQDAVLTSFLAVGGDGALLIVDGDRPRIAVGVGEGDRLLFRDVSTRLELDPDAQDQQMAVARAGDDAWVIAGPAGTEVQRSDSSAVLDPLPQFSRLFGIGDGVVASVNDNTIQIILAGDAGLGIVPVPQSPVSGQAVVTAAGGGRIFRWGGSSNGSGPQAEGAIYRLYE